MYLQHSKKRLFLFFLLSLITLRSAYALDSDKYQPIDIAADTALLDDKAGKAVYRGNVQLTQGSLKIIAEQIVIEAGDVGKVKKVIATGNLAQFFQTPKEQDKPIEAEANTVEYHVADEKIVLTENARVVQNNNIFEGNIIEYDIKLEKLQAHGKTLTGGTGSSNGDGRVKMVLQPQTEPEPEPEPENNTANEVSD